MSKKNYRTLDGLYKALQKQKRTYADVYTFEKTDEDIIIFNAEDSQGAISGTLIEDLMPVLKRSCWMVSHDYLHNRMQLVVWLIDDFA